MNVQYKDNCFLKFNVSYNLILLRKTGKHFLQHFNT